MSLFRYSAFGLHIESEIEIPEFIPSDKNPDVFIRLGQVPRQLPNPLFKGVRFEASPGQFLLNVDNIARFFTENGTSVTIEPFIGAEQADIRLFLLGSAFGALIHQRGMLPMHGSAVSINNKAYIFSGISGAGKSTLAAALIEKGYKLLSDDISVITILNNNPVVFGGYPGVKLWADSLVKLGKSPDLYARVRSKLNKHHLNLRDKFHADPLELGGVYILLTKNSEGIQIESVKGIEKFNILKNNTYRLNFIKGLGNNESHFRHLAALAAACNVKKLTRSSKSFSLDELLMIFRNY